MKHRRKINLRIYSRALVALGLLIGWSLTAMTGLSLWFAPHGPGSSKNAFLLGLTSHQWGDIHVFTSLFALVLTVIHVSLDWQSLKKLIRYLYE